MVKATGITFALALCLSAAGQALAQQRGQPRPPQQVGITIRGRVSHPDGRPVDSAIRVTLRLSTGSVIMDQYTDSSGSFEFRSVPVSAAANLELVAWGMDAYETTVVHVDINTSFSSTIFRDIVLRAKKKVITIRPGPGAVPLSALGKTIPKSARKAYQRAVKYSEKKRYQKAVTHYQLAIKRYDRYFQAYNDMGLAYNRLGQFENARAAFNKAIRIEPKAFQPYLNLGQMQLQQQQFAEARKNLSRAVELTVTDWRAHLWLGVCLINGRLDADLAEVELKKAIEYGQAPGTAIAHLYLANINIGAGRLPEAIVQAEAYLQELPNASNAQRVRDYIEKMRAEIKRQKTAEPQ